MNTRWSWLAVFFLSITLMGASVRAQSIIIDTDMAADDWIAILYLAEQPNISIAAITVTGSGEARCAAGVPNAIKLLQLTKQPNVPVTCGRDERLEGGNLFPASWRVDMDNLLGFRLSDGNKKPVSTPAVDLIHRIITKNPDAAILTLGPFTNIADLIAKYPQDIPSLKVTAMAGAFEHPGNVYLSTEEIPNHLSEWNAFADALALKRVVESGVQVTFIPLDATEYAPLTPEVFQKFTDMPLTKAGQFIFEVLARDKDFARLEGYYFWDPVAAFALLSPHSFDYKTVQVQIPTDPIAERGQTKIVPTKGIDVKYANWLNYPEFEKHFLATFAREN